MYGELLEPGGDTSRFFEPADTALDHIATTIRGAVELERAATLGAPVLGSFLLRNNCAYPMFSEPAAHRSVIVSFIAGEHLRSRSRTATPSLRLRDLDSTQDRCGVSGFLSLCGTQLNSQQESTSVSDQMQFRRETAAATPESVIAGLAELAMHALIFSPRPLHVYVPERSNHRRTKASTQSL